ncbi:hypothetical protein [Flavobacterium sp.]|uniref:hypothetical protein n=1 Tax=Flavobacterium sp. TaxID=239 RepID=UPI002FDA81F6
MKKFVIKILIFLFPLLMFFGLPCYYLYRYDENFNRLTLSDNQKERHLVGYLYNEGNYDYLKWNAINSDQKYTVISLGSSRVLQFRKEMFNDSFYNAGFAISRVNEFLPFLKSLKKDNLPQYLIISLDQWMFNYNWDKLEAQPNPDKWESAFQFTPKLFVINAAWKDFFDGKFSKINPKKDGVVRVGLNAYVNDTGFRNDGSFFYGKQITKRLVNDSTMADYKFRDTKERINKGISRFEYGNNVNPKAIAELKKLILFCKANKIHLIAFLPPFSNEVNRYMQEQNKYEYMDKIYPAIYPLFAAFDMELYDFKQLSLVNSDDRETIDGFHGGEVTYLKILIEMLEKKSMLNKVSDLNSRKNELKKRINNYTIYNTGN